MLKPGTRADAQVVLLDDSPTFLLSVESLLVARGISVSTTTRWQELPSLLASKPDLVILDMNLGEPTVDGLAVGRMLRRFYDAPILFLSSEPEAQLRAATKAVENSTYLSKSCDLSDRLPAAIRALALAGARVSAGDARG